MPFCRVVSVARWLVCVALWGAAGPASAKDPGANAAAEFSRRDTNEDGYLSGREAQGLTALDKNQDGRITREEWGARAGRPAGSRAEAEQQFAALDVNEDGRLSGTEAARFQEFDRDRDGRVTKKEFLAGLGYDSAGTTPAADGPSVARVPVRPRREPTAWDRELAKQFDAGRHRALLVGVNRYPRMPLSFCVPDAKLLAEVLIRNGGYAQDDVVLLTDDLENRELHPNKASIQLQLERMLSVSGPKDTLLLFFTGHGVALNDRSYFCPLDFDGGNPGATAISFDNIRQQLSGCRAAQKVLVLDCCHAGGAFNTPFSVVNRDLGGAFERAQGLITLASCRANESSLESGRDQHGIFTLSLAHGLAGTADYDGNQLVDSDEIYRHVLAEVPVEAAVWQPGHAQTPVRIIGHDVVGVFCLTRPQVPSPGDDPALGPRRKPGDAITNSLGMRLVYLPHAAFPMGSPPDESQRNEDETLRPVVITAPTLIGAYEVTQGEFTRVMGFNPSYFSPEGEGSALVRGLDTSRFPVEQVTWPMAKDFCARLTALPAEQSAKRRYRLPTEAEWEFACRGGTTTVFHTGEVLTGRDANIRADRPYGPSEPGDALGRTCTVGAYPPNGFRLFDLHGNVSEWCLDRYGRYEGFSLAVDRPLRNATEVALYMQEFMTSPSFLGRALRDPRGPPAGDQFVHRGGSFASDVSFCRSAARRRVDPDYQHRTLGFRIVVEVAGTQ